MRSFYSSLLPLTTAALAAAQSIKLESFPGTVKLTEDFDPIKEAYWTGLPHHRRTPFSLSPDGSRAYLAYLDGSGEGVHVRNINPKTFEPRGKVVTVDGVKEAGGLVAHNDGFALLGNEAMPSSTSDAPPDGTPVPAIYRYKSGEQAWKTFVGGPGVNPDAGLMMSPDMNGDLAWSGDAQMYGAYFVVTAYTGDAKGHFGDSIQYVDADGKLQTIEGASSSWGCSHNTGIAFAAADEPPFASLCAEDQGAIWLNTNGQGMGTNGVKVSNENTTNGGGGESMGGMGGSYSGLARFADSDSYIFAWVSRGALELSENDWMGEGYTHTLNRTNGRRAAIAIFSDKETKSGAEATSELGEGGDEQVNWVSEEGPDASNAHVAVFNDQYALVSWEEIANPQCEFIAMGCGGDFSGTYYQLVDKTGKTIGEAVKSMDIYVAGDMVTMGDGRICWPYVEMEWSLNKGSGFGSVEGQTNAEAISFACMTLNQ